MTQKKLFIIISSVITILLGAILSMVVFSLSASNAAQEDIAVEASRLREMTAAVKDDTDTIRNELNDIESELSTSDTVNNYYMEYKKTHDSLVQEINELNEKITLLDNQIEEKLAQNNSGQLSNPKTGRKYELKANTSYICPDEIPAGRYTANGSGTLTIINSSGRTRVSQNLSVSIDNSYTFDISNKEKLQVTDEVRLTELK